MPSKTCDRKSRAMRSRHSWGPVAELGSMPAKSGKSWCVMSMPAWHLAMRGSVASVAVSGGGHGASASQVLRNRRERSQASRKLSAVDPVRGRPSPKSGATICWPSISG